MNTGLIGTGYWGKILKSKLERISTLHFSYNSKEDYKSMLHLVDWVFIATPDKTHFQIVKKIIKKKINIFCEKPLTLNHKKSNVRFRGNDAILTWKNKSQISRS